MSRIDLNADLGEGFGAWRLGDDEAMLDVVTSANLACGFHAGDPATLHRTCRAAAQRGIRIGAQVGYRDLAGFGRRFIDIAADDLYADVVYQIGALDALARTVDSSVSYVKPHGALYNTIIHHEVQADAVARAVRDVNAQLPVLTLPHGVFGYRASELGLRVIPEAFADRGYRDDGTLVPRGEPGAVLNDPATVANRVLAMVRTGSVAGVSGVSVPVHAESICLHGDSPGAVDMAVAVRTALVANGIALAPFV
ncbi:5-oxoprolinase subunit PxpA [Mycobacterium sp. NPDC050853]|uniref:LamB/YcsF family protein n=1 Tax=Mycobacterium sp. NPDC050853 TaxID=3155160 RepID=UPI003402EBA9